MEPSFSVTVERGAQPLHVAIAEQLTAAIAAGTLPPGTRLPPERELAESLGVSRMTVRQALGDLERDGLLRRVVGRAGGTFVREPEQAGRRRRSRCSQPRGGAAPPGRRVRGRADLRGDRACRQADRGRARHQAERSASSRSPGSASRAESRSPSSARRSRPSSSPTSRTWISAARSPTLMEGFGLRPVRSVERLELTVARPADVRALGVRRDGPLLLRGAGPVRGRRHARSSSPATASGPTGRDSCLESADVADEGLAAADVRRPERGERVGDLERLPGERELLGRATACPPRVAARARGARALRGARARASGSWPRRRSRAPRRRPRGAR